LGLVGLEDLLETRSSKGSELRCEVLAFRVADFNLQFTLPIESLSTMLPREELNSQRSLYEGRDGTIRRYNVVYGTVLITVSQGVTHRVPLELLREWPEVDKLWIREVNSMLKSLGVPVISVEVRENPHLGVYVMLKVNADARQALELWLRLLDVPWSIKIPLFVEWTGRTDVSPEELGRYLGRALAKMGVFPSTVKPIDVVKMLREE